MAPQPGGQQPGQCGQDRPAGPVEPGPGDLTAQDGEFTAEDQDLGVLRRLAAAEQLQPAKDPDDGEVQEPDRRSPRSCFIAVSRPNCRSQPLYRVLEQYKPLRLAAVAGLSLVIGWGRQIAMRNESLCAGGVDSGIVRGDRG